ncbi:VAN3-binding protein-like isoform X2 [Glycine soja]|uniref:VAN3-binding protein-like isoform X2 n=1 Tax=Glycine soja TaxID=3848 RepID=UPI00103C6D05|nr:VAN3-binding protein-like isoform X2 [Glycine soja]
MASDFNLSPSDAHPETMDFLSLAWCNFAVQALQPEPQHGSVVLLDNNSMKQLEPSSPNALPSSDRMDGADFGSFPAWKSNNVKSWIWMQQAMHPELNYNSCFRKKWMPWKQIIPLKNVSIKKWFKEIKMKRKEDQRLQRAEVHAAISVAGIAAALAAIAAESSKNESNQDRDAAVASAAALVAAQCAKVAEAMGAKKELLSTVIGSAMSGTSASDILTLTAAAATSLKGAATLKVRSGCKNRLNGGVPILPLEDNNDLDFDFEKGRSILAQGAELYVETPEGKYMPRSVSVILNSEAKVVLMMRKHNLFKSKREGVVMTLHADLYKGSEAEDADTCYLIVLTTRGGVFKLDMADDFRRYKTWATTINHMLKISSSFAKYELQFY